MGPNLDAQLDTEIDGLQEAFAGAISGGDDGNPVAGPDDEDGVTRDMSTDCDSRSICWFERRNLWMWYELLP